MGYNDLYQGVNKYFSNPVDSPIYHSQTLGSTDLWLLGNIENKNRDTFFNQEKSLSDIKKLTFIFFNFFWWIKNRT